MSDKKAVGGKHVAEENIIKHENKLRTAVIILAGAVVLLVVVVVFLLVRNSQVPKSEPAVESVVESTPTVSQTDEAVIPEQAEVAQATAVPEETPEQIVSGPPVPLTSASQLTAEALEQMKSKTLECIRQEEAGWYEGNSIESVDYLGRVCLVRKDETAPNDNECNIIYRVNMVSRSGSSIVNFSYYYPVKFSNLQVYPDGRCEVNLDSCIKPHFFRAIGLLFYGIETPEQLEHEYITGKSIGWTMDSDVTLN